MQTARVPSKTLFAVALFASLMSFVVPASAQSEAYAQPASLRAESAAYDRDGASAGTNYHLGTGDQIRVIVYNEDDLGGQFTLDGNGVISLPLIGQVRASGLSVTDLETQITAKLADGYVNDPRVSVEITQYRPFYVIGQVGKPGEYAYVNGMTVLNAIALAGGYTDQADDSDVYVRRNGTAKEAEVPADQTTHIYPGDVVRVTRSTFWSVMSVLAPVGQIAAPLAYVARP